jgi:hypothetical protein
MFHADSMYVKGHSHKVCQDYAAHNEIGAAISDGCSSSRDTDIGARLIVRDRLFGDGLLSIYNLYGKDYFSKEMFDATRLAITCKEDLLHVSIIGDGGVAFVDADNDLWFLEYIYPAGYPRYMSYLIDKERACMLSSYQTKIVCNVYKNGYPVDMDSNRDSFLELYYYATKSAAVFSDGIESFTDKEGSKVEAVDIVTELMAFKNTQGEFVTRRMSRFLKDCEKRGWSHYDDLSMAAIVVDR